MTGEGLATFIPWHVLVWYYENASFLLTITELFGNSKIVSYQFTECSIQKQPSRGVIKKRCSENRQQILHKNTHAEVLFQFRQLYAILLGPCASVYSLHIPVKGENGCYLSWNASMLTIKRKYGDGDQMNLRLVNNFTLWFHEHVVYRKDLTQFWSTVAAFQ